MAVSASDSPSQIPGFRDRLGERVIVPQQSGALLEYLHFCDRLAAAPFLATALKDRVARLANFRHSSYCRVRRLQNLDGEGRPALVSAHIAGRRLSEILEVAARAELRPSAGSVLSVTRQLMASVALLHDFAPHGFHGALGPERLILPGEGRVVVAEHVLGTVVELAASAWGVQRLWQEFGIAVLPDTHSDQFGRRVDVLQVGLVTLAMLLGRPLGASDYPHALPGLLDEVAESTPDGAHAPLRAPLRGWLERTLGLLPDTSFRTLLEAQKALGQLIQEEGYPASSVAWDAFVGICQTAALRVPVVIVTSEPPTSANVLPRPEAETKLTLDDMPPADPPADQGGPPTAGASFADETESAPIEMTDPVARLREDPFGPWPVSSPAGSAATLLDTLDVPAAKPTAGAALVAATTGSDRPGPDPGTMPTESVGPPASESRPQTLFESPKPTPFGMAAPVPAPVPTPGSSRQVPWEERRAPAATSVADWRTRDRSQDLSYLVLNEGQEPEEQPDGADAEPRDEDGLERRARRIRLAVLVGLTLLATTAAVLAPYAWNMLYEGRLVQGTLSISSDPPGGVVSVDGQVRGHTPADLSMRAGEHLVEVQVGGSAKSKKVVVAANSKSVEKMTFPEAGERGGLMIATYPSKAKITVDGVFRGAAPLKVTDLQPGTHTLVLETVFGLQEQDVIVQPGRVSQLAVPTVSWIKVNAPYELTVFENGRRVGTVGTSPVMVSPGRRNLEFVNQELGLRLRQFVDAVAGQVVTVPLELPTGMMNLFSDQNADVLVDGKLVGQTPLSSFEVPLGSHDVVFRHPKYGEVRYKVAVTLVAPVKLTVTFRK